MALILNVKKTKLDLLQRVFCLKMVSELPGFGLAPGEEDKGNESEPELETSKMVQVGFCLDDHVPDY